MGYWRQLSQLGKETDPCEKGCSVPALQAQRDGSLELTGSQPGLLGKL